jgi:arylsulfatase
MPEFMAPGLGKQNNRVFMDIEIGENANGVLYALGGSSGGITVYLQDGYLTYLYNMLIIEQYKLTTDEPIAAGKHQIEVDTRIVGLGKSGTVVIKVDGKSVGTLKLKQTVPAAFTASETFDVGVDLGSTVSLSYADLRPFEFQGKINKMNVDLK